MAFHHFIQELQESGFIAGSGGKGFQNLALMIHSPPQIMLLAVDLHKHLVEVPPPNGYRPAVNALTSDFSGEHRPDRFHQKRTVSWQMSIPRSASRSSTFLSDRGYLTYIITTRRITSGELLKWRNGLCGIALDLRLIRVGYHCWAYRATFV